MALIVDYHMHLRNDRGEIDHRLEAVAPFVERARERGVEEIGFTEHVYYFRETRECWRIPYQTERCVYSLGDYVDAVEEAKQQGLPVKLGLEVDWFPPENERLAELLAAYPWDYLLGSVHWLEGDDINDAPGKGIWARCTPEEVWRLYVDAWTEAARSGLFDAMSHPDVPKLFGDRGGDDAYAEMAAAANDAGVALEISTAGLREAVRQLYPDWRLLRGCDAPVTLASDAHEPALVGEDFDRAIAHARACGRETVTVFERRLSHQEPLG